MKVAVCIPSLENVPTAFAMCLVALFSVCSTHKLPGTLNSSVCLINKRSSILPKSRQELLEDALDRRCTHALFIDSDQTFPSNMLHKLVMRQRSVVACNIATKTIPANTTARTLDEKKPAGGLVFSDERDDLQQVWRVGCGIMFIDLAVVKRLPKPWFMQTYDSTYKEWVGEDWYFCKLLEEAGVPIYVDHELSKRVGHVGHFEYTHEWVGEVMGEPAATPLVVS